jgi:hypothetical protein
MLMVPRTIRRQLGRLRRRERLFRLVWGAARWLALAGVLLAVACSIDWMIDCRQETPLEVRQAMLWFQTVAGGVAVLVFVLIPFFRRIDGNRLALYVEEREPKFGHRLISAIQLNQRGAVTAGMSPELIAQVTREAEALAVRTSFTALADRRRLLLTGLLVAPLLTALAILFVMWPATVLALLERQLLVDREIPRAVRLESAAAELIWPAGEEGMLRYRVVGMALSEGVEGEVRVDAEGQGSEIYPLVLESRADSGEAVYAARVPPMSADFRHRAWLSNSRSRQPARVQYEPRPVVQKQEAWVVLPSYCGLRFNWQAQAAVDCVPQLCSLPHPPLALLAVSPFEEYQKGADIVRRLPGSGARVAIATQKPIASASLEVLGPAGQAGEAVRRRVDLTVRDKGQQAECSFLLEPGDSAYRIAVRDRHGFDNTDPPRRSIRSVPVDPPQVALLAELFRHVGDAGAAEDYEVEGMPVPLGRKVRIGYSSAAPYGLRRAQLRYRVLPASLPEEKPMAEDDIPWLRYPLKYVAGSPVSGPFIVQRGLFARSGEDDQVEFHAVPAMEIDQIGGLDGGGRFDFQTKGIPDGKGGLLDLKVGDRIEYFVEVFDRIPDPDRPAGRSEVRVKNIVSIADWLAWKKEKERQEERLSLLEAKQRGVFGGTKPPVEDEPARTVVNRPPLRRVERSELPPGVMKFGRAWQLMGPFPNPEDRGHAAVYPPETERFDLSNEFDGIKGKIHWKPFISSTDKIDLEKYFNHSEAGVAYAVCWFRCDRKKAVLGTGSDDGIKVWINRQLIVDKPVHREAVPGDDLTPVELTDGWNACFVKVDNKFGSWAFYLDLRDVSTGQPLGRVDVRIMPIEEADKKYVQEWQILGPFPNTDDRGLDTVYPPELEKTNLDKEYDGRDGKIRWNVFLSDKDKIDFHKGLSVPFENSPGAAYAVCWVQCDNKQRAALLVTGNDGGIKVWINRRVVLTKQAQRDALPGDDLTKITLNPGWNEILVKVAHQSGRWGFHLELREPDKPRTLEKVTYRLRTPEEKGSK